MGMTLLVALGLWALVSVAFTPLIGYFLTETPGHAYERRAQLDFVSADILDLQPSSRPKA
jgi:hypothetical protein